MKIAPGYTSPVVHVLDASLAVNVVRKLMSPDDKNAFVQDVQAKQQKTREAYAIQDNGQKTCIIGGSKKTALSTLHWETASIAKPRVLGCKVLEDVALETLVPIIDWSPFFHAWQLRGKFPKIFEDLGGWAKSQRTL